MIAEILPEQISSYEAERGKPKPSESHSIVQANLIIEFAKNSGYRPMSELAIRLNDIKYIPDVCVYLRQPKSFLHDISERTDPPLMAVEIYSPNQGYNTIMEKVDAYLAGGVKSCWVVDPYQLTISILSPDGGAVTFIHGQVASDPFTGIKADLSEVFS